MNSDPNLPTAEESPAHAAISLLIDLAQRGEIDPWDVDVIKVIDRFFQDLNQFQVHQASLPQSGQALLWASMLVSLKADTLEALAEEQEEEETSSEASTLEAEEKSQGRKLPQKLEHHIRRRGSPPPVKKRRVTLSELITHIKELATEIDKSSPQNGASRSQGKRETAQMISHLAHNENLTELATEIEQFLMREASELTPEQDWVSLEQLTAWWNQEKENSSEQEHTEAMTEKASRVGIFWALLLLCAQSKVELSQEEFYQDLNLRFL